MRMFDFSPYFRSSIGFDRVFDLLESASRLDFSDSWPPHDIIKTGADTYQVVLAIPGFTAADLSVTHEGGHLVIRGRKDDAQPAGEFLYRGLGERTFEQRFELADHIRVTDASLSDGMLRIGLVREVPEHLKPRQIPIQTSMLPKWTARKQLPPANSNGQGDGQSWWKRLTSKVA